MCLATPQSKTQKLKEEILPIYPKTSEGPV